MNQKKDLERDLQKALLDVEAALERAGVGFDKNENKPQLKPAPKQKPAETKLPGAEPDYAQPANNQEIPVKEESNPPLEEAAPQEPKNNALGDGVDETSNKLKGAGRDSKAIRDQVKELRTKRAKKKKRNRLLVLSFLTAAAVIAAIIMAVVLLPDIINSNKNEAVVSETSSSVPEKSEPAPSVAVSEPESQPEAVSSAPVPVKEIAFSEEDVTRLNTMLDDWAARDMPMPVEDSSASDAASISVSSKKTYEIPRAENFGHNVAVYFKDIKSGAEYVYNGDYDFFVASVSKAPYALFIYECVSEGRANLQDVFTIDAKDIEGSETNSGRIKNETELPKDYTLEELLSYLLRYSDTVAQRVLLKKYPASEFAAWAEKLNLKYPQHIKGVTSGRLTAVDAGVYLKALYDYMENGEYGLQLKDNLYNAGNPMIRSENPVAHKYGWDESAYHDIAVVYGENPYLIAILSDKSAGNYEDLIMFKQITETFESIISEKYAT